jgi:hypothetical protein
MQISEVIRLVGGYLKLIRLEAFFIYFIVFLNIASLHPPEHPTTAAVLNSKVKRTPCILQTRNDFSYLHTAAKDGAIRYTPRCERVPTADWK